MEEKDKSMKKKVSMGTENASPETKRGADMSKENEGYPFNHAVNNRENEIEESKSAAQPAYPIIFFIAAANMR